LKFIFKTNYFNIVFRVVLSDNLIFFFINLKRFTTLTLAMLFILKVNLILIIFIRINFKILPFLFKISVKIFRFYFILLILIMIFALINVFLLNKKYDIPFNYLGPMHNILKSI